MATRGIPDIVTGDSHGVKGQSESEEHINYKSAGHILKALRLRALSIGASNGFYDGCSEISARHRLLANLISLEKLHRGDSFGACVFGPGKGSHASGL